MTVSTYKVTYTTPNYGGSREMQVQAESHSEAEDLVRNQIPSGSSVGNSYVVHEDSSSWFDSGSGGDFWDGKTALITFLIGLFLIIEFWMYIIPITLAVAILYYFIKKEN